MLGLEPRAVVKPDRAVGIPERAVISPERAVAMRGVSPFEVTPCAASGTAGTCCRASAGVCEEAEASKSSISSNSVIPSLSAASVSAGAGSVALGFAGGAGLGSGESKSSISSNSVTPPLSAASAGAGSIALGFGGGAGLGSGESNPPPQARRGKIQIYQASQGVDYNLMQSIRSSLDFTYRQPPLRRNLSAT